MVHLTNRDLDNTEQVEAEALKCFVNILMKYKQVVPTLVEKLYFPPILGNKLLAMRYDDPCFFVLGRIVFQLALEKPIANTFNSMNIAEHLATVLFNCFIIFIFLVSFRLLSRI